VDPTATAMLWEPANPCLTKLASLLAIPTPTERENQAANACSVTHGSVQLFGHPSRMGRPVTMTACPGQAITA